MNNARNAPRAKTARYAVALCRFSTTTCVSSGRADAGEPDLVASPVLGFVEPLILRD
ncbi:hypothetical protein ACRAKI_22130 [Saccharothrix isguenensis]